MNVSISICTWNRAKLLDQTLEKMRNLRIPEGVEWEVLVVNNHCTDDTDDVIRCHQKSLPLRHLHEDRPGKSYAVNLSVREAQGDLILFTDDDVLVAEDWIATYVAAANDWPDASFFGGTVDYWFESEPPRWLFRNLRLLTAHYALRNVSPSIIPFPDGESPFGANMAIRREALKAFQFNTNLGPTKNNQVRGEELELLKRMKDAGHKGIWVGPAKVRHFIPTERLNKKFIWEWSRGHGRSYVRVFGMPECPTVGGVPRWVLRKYIEKRLQSLFLNPFKNAAWVKSYIWSAYLQGIMDEVRDSQKRAMMDALPATSS